MWPAPCVVLVLGADVGKNSPAHLVAWIHTHDTDGIVYGGDKAALDKGFAAWADASFADGLKALCTQGSIVKFNGSVVRIVPPAQAPPRKACWALSLCGSTRRSATGMPSPTELQDP